MPPNLLPAIAQWAHTPLETLLAPTEQEGGQCLPPKAIEQGLALHRVAVDKVPAYAQLVAADRAPAMAEDGAVQLCESWDQVPLLTKDAFVQFRPLAQRCAGGQLGAASFVHQSSGSSGEPALWARSLWDELDVCTRFEQAFADNWEAHRVPTLAVVALPLGAWVGGLYTALALHWLNIKGYKLTVVTPGNNVQAILGLVRALAPQAGQTVLIGYPPFLKGVVDAGVAAGVPWGEYRMRLCLAGEVFSEEWRTLMAQRLGMTDILRDVVSLYGTADAGVIAQETPLSVAIRRWLAARPAAAARLFGAHRLPTLAQYDPHSRLLEAHPQDGSLVVSTVGTPHAAAPLLRYCIKDAGGILSYADMLARLAQEGFEVPAGLRPRRLPFVWVFGRSFWTVSLFGANVYVENLMAGLEQPELAEATTGKLVLYVEESADLDRQLAVRVELAHGVEPSEALAEQVADVLLRELVRLNSEYASYCPPERQRPLVRLHRHGDPDWFPVGVKHSWTR